MLHCNKIIGTTMRSNFLDEMTRAAKLVSAGKLSTATSVIQEALGRSSPVPPVLERPDPDVSTLDGYITEVDAPAKAPEPEVVPPAPAAARGPVSNHDLFSAGYFHEQGIQGRYKVFVPSRRGHGPLSLVVMLHGCTQSPDDFAAGTEMNERAAEQGFVVLYPAQSTAANPSRCWNWFKREDQARGAGEPALLAAMTRAIVDEYGLDDRRVAIAGLSAGGAMAAIVASAYPELFAAVGIHSGLPVGSARNVPDALSVMRTGQRRKPRTVRPETEQGSIPTIVFHGDVDQTVHPLNGASAIDAAVEAHGGTGVQKEVLEGSSGGKSFRRSVYTTADASALAEHWVVRGTAHAWSGGNVRGTYTDSRGPSATDEMLRFFATAVEQRTRSSISRPASA